MKRREESAMPSTCHQEAAPVADDAKYRELQCLPGGVFMSTQRQRVCLEAAWELDAVARLLPGLVPCPEDDTTPHLAVRCIAGRFVRLASLLMSGLSDSCEKTARLETMINLERGQA